MRVTICCKQFRSRGGAETFLANFTRCLIDDGHAVRVITPDADTDQDAVEVVRLDVPWRPRAFGDLALARAAHGTLAGDDADVTFSDQKCWGADVVRPGGGIRRCYVRERPKSYRGLSRRAFNWVRWKLSPREWLRIRIDDRLYAPPGPRRVIANSDMVRRQVEEHYPHVADRVRVIYNGADPERFHPGLRREHRARVREELGIPEDAIVGVFVGGDWRRKGLHTFVEALGILARKGTPRAAYGIAVGRGKRAGMERLAARCGAAGRVRLIGRAAPEPYYGAADLLVLPSFYDPCANVTMEGLACGLPALTSVHNGAFELLTPGLTGLAMSDAADAAQLAGFIEHYMDEDRLTAGSRAARELALEYPLERMYRATMAVLEEAAAGERT